MKRKILTIIIMLVIVVGNVYAQAPTVREILEKKLANDKARVTMEGKVINEWYVPENNKIFESNGYVWMKGKDRYRLEIYNAQQEVAETTIVNSSATVSINNLGTYVIDKREKEQTGPVELTEGELIEEDTDKFLEYFSCVIKKVDGDIYTIEMIPTSKSVVYNQIKKIEEEIDYAKGCEIRGVIYDTSNTAIVTTEFSNFQLIKEVWIALQKSTKTVNEGNTIINIIKYEGLKLNEGIDDSLFSYEIPEEGGK